MANIFTCRRPNRLGGGAIDHPDRSEQVPDQQYIPDVTEKIFKDDISMIHRQKTFIFGVLKAFITVRSKKMNQSKNVVYFRKNNRF